MAIMRLFSERFVNPLDLQPDQIDVQDIAHALSHVNRFNGHTVKPISVAQHSVYVSRLCESHGLHVAFQALFHDASEAYLGDVTKWLKMSPCMAGYREAEERAQTVIFESLGVSPILHERVEWADVLMVRFEAEKGFGPGFTFVGIDGKPHPSYPRLMLSERVQIGAWAFWNWRQSREGFLDQYRHLLLRMHNQATDDDGYTQCQTILATTKGK